MVDDSFDELDEPMPASCWCMPRSTAI